MHVEVRVDTCKLACWLDLHSKFYHTYVSSLVADSEIFHIPLIIHKCNTACYYIIAEIFQIHSGEI